MVTPISQPYIDKIKAFRADCDVLIEKLRKENTIDFRTFSRFWNSMNFDQVFGKTIDIYSRNGTEHDFLHDALQIAKLVMLHDSFSCGLYLMHKLYFSKSNSMYFKIRLGREEFNHMLRMFKVKDEEENQNKINKLELSVIFARLLKGKAFHFVTFGREYDMEGYHRAEMIYNNQYVFYDEDNITNVRPKEWVHNISKVFPKELKELDNEYLNLKSKIKAAFPYLNLNLDLVNEDITTALMRSLTQANSMAESEEADTSIGAKRRALKKRKMKIRHRYKKEQSDEELDEDESRPTPVPVRKNKRGAPKGARSNYFFKAINEPDLTFNSESDEDECSNQESLPIKLELPNLN